MRSFRFSVSGAMRFSHSSRNTSGVTLASHRGPHGPRVSDKTRMSRARSTNGERKARTVGQATCATGKRAVDQKGLAPGVQLAAGVLKPSTTGRAERM